MTYKHIVFLSSGFKNGEIKMRCKFTVIFLLVLSSLNFSQNNFIPFMVDYAFYRYTTEKSYMELYISFYQNNLDYVEKDNQFEAIYELTVQIFEGDSVINQQKRFSQSIIRSLDEIDESKQFVEVMGFELSDKSYDYKITLEDSNSNSAGDYLFSINPKLFKGDSLMISDIELATSISRANTESDFNKNALQVMPNPSTTYGIKMPVLYYYAEIYNLDYDKSNPGEYLVRCNITDRDGEIIKEFPDKIHKKQGETAVLVNAYNIVTLPSDVYSLNLEVVDQQSEEVISQSKRFNFQKLVRPTLVSSDTTEENYQRASGSEYAWMNEADLDREFNYASYIAGNEEKRIYESLNLEGKRKFLSEFWKRRANEPDAPPSAFKFDYLERVQMANSNFGSGSLEGWESDRGRVLLVYGYPDEIERHYMDVDRKPYEIWIFNDIEGGVRFYFADISGFGEFELVHSTHSHELQNPDWEKLIHKAETGFDFDSPFRN